MGTRNQATLIAELSQLLDQKLEAKLSPIEAKLTPLQNSIDELKGTLVTHEEVKAIVQQQTDQLIAENKLLREKVLNLECQSRRNNLQFLGIAEATKETWAECEQKVKEITQLGLDSNKMIIERAHRLGAVKTRARPIIAKFLSFKDKEVVLQRFRSRDRESDFPDEVIIVEDYPSEIADRRRKLLPFPRTAQFMKVECRLAVDKLTINGIVYTADSLDDIPKEYHPQATKDLGDNIVAFYGKGSPFSNFYRAQFSDDSKTFYTVEQYLVYKKAKYFNDNTLADEVLGMDDPAKIKAKGRSVKGFKANLWRQEELKVMEEGLTCKFDQNPTLKDLLRSTRNKTLVEASPRDRYWGAGLSLFNPKLETPQMWPGKNKLGELLMQVRLAVCG